MVEVKRGAPGSSKSNPYKASRYRRIETNKFGCIIKVDDRFEAHYPLNTPSRINNAKTRMEAHKREPVTRKCINVGLKGNICKAARREGMTDTDWYKEECK